MQNKRSANDELFIALLFLWREKDVERARKGVKRKYFYAISIGFDRCKWKWCDFYFSISRSLSLSKLSRDFSIHLPSSTARQLFKAYEFLHSNRNGKTSCRWSFLQVNAVHDLFLCMRTKTYNETLKRTSLDSFQLVFYKRALEKWSCQAWGLVCQRCLPIMEVVNNRKVSTVLRGKVNKVHADSFCARLPTQKISTALAFVTNAGFPNIRNLDNGWTVNSLHFNVICTRLLLKCILFIIIGVWPFDP